MDFVPHTEQDRTEMLEAIGLEHLADLFESVPDGFLLDGDLEVPAALSEVELLDHVAALADRNAGSLVCFAGGGAYDHHVPSAVASLASRAEFATSYTPYQPELSQGVLQAVFEFQSLVCEIYGMEVANASLYDGASALVEAVNLAVRIRKRERLLVAGNLHPHYLQVLRTLTSGIALDIEDIPYEDDGTIAWSEVEAGGCAAVVSQYPNFFGRLEDIGAASDAAHGAGALSIVVADPTAMGVLASPGSLGADVVVGEGHALGNPMSYGGPYVGLFATRLEHVRQVPGRIAGETLDADGRRAIVLTLQAREQHIRRARATSNVCTNQTLMAIAAAIHLAWLGPNGLRRLGELCLQRTEAAARRLSEVPGVEIACAGPRFKEIVIRTPIGAERLVSGLAKRGFLAGPALGRFFPDLDNCLLVAVTERRSADEVNALAEALEKELANV